jgi:hypothetical protein
VSRCLVLDGAIRFGPHEYDGVKITTYEKDLTFFCSFACPLLLCLSLDHVLYDSFTDGLANAIRKSMRLCPTRPCCQSLIICI